MKKILYGICGIGLGHTFRQLPIVEYLVANRHHVVIFGYGESLKFYRNRFDGVDNVDVFEVAVPFYVGNKDGLDLDATRNLESNKGIDYDSINNIAMDKVSKILGKPDLIITDYEPISAKYSYANNVPLITIDQQSKCLCANFPKELGGETYADEIARLDMFFPKADKRIACSFFNVEQKQDCKYDVTIVSPILREEVLKLKRELTKKQSVLVYISSNKESIQSSDEIAKVLSGFPDTDFNVFLPTKASVTKKTESNVKFYSHGNSEFNQILSTCHGLVSTAGHSLLSEAMYLDIPVYAMPLAVYEQKMNAYIIAQSNFGISDQTINQKSLSVFLKEISTYRSNIQNDTKILLRDIGQKVVISEIKKFI